MAGPGGQSRSVRRVAAPPGAVGSRRRAVLAPVELDHASRAAAGCALRADRDVDPARRGAARSRRARPGRRAAGRATSEMKPGRIRRSAADGGDGALRKRPRRRAGRRRCPRASAISVTMPWRRRSTMPASMPSTMSASVPSDADRLADQDEDGDLGQHEERGRRGGGGFAWELLSAIWDAVSAARKGFAAARWTCRETCLHCGGIWRAARPARPTAVSRLPG